VGQHLSSPHPIRRELRAESVIGSAAGGIEIFGRVDSLLETGRHLGFGRKFRGCGDDGPATPTVSTVKAKSAISSLSLATRS